LLAKSCWADHATTAEMMNNLRDKLKESQEAVAEAEAELEECQVAQGQEDFEELERAVGEVEDRKASAEAEVADKQNAAKAKLSELTAARAVQRDAQAHIDEQASKLNLAKKDLEVAHERMKESAEGNVRTLMEEIDNIQREIASRSQEEEQTRAERDQLRAAVQQADAKLKQAHNKVMAIQGEVESCQQQLRNASSGDSNATTRRLAALGNELPRVVADIDKARFRERPIGPVGLHVKMKDGRGEWSQAVEKILGLTLKAFVVSNTEDQYTLRGILMRHQCANLIKIVYQERRARYNVPLLDGVLTVNDVIAVDNDAVFNCLIDQVNPDLILMCKNENDLQAFRGARGFLNPKVKKAVLSNGDEIQYNNFGNTKNHKNRYPFRHMLAEDMREQQALLQSEIATLEQSLVAAKQERDEMQAQKNAADKEQQKVGARLETLGGTIRKLKRSQADKTNELNEAEEAGKVDTTEIEGRIATAETKLRLANDAKQSALEDIDGLGKEHKELAESAKKAIQEVSKIDEELREAERRVTNFQASANKRKQKLNAASHKVGTTKGAMERIQAQLDVQEQELAAKYEAASTQTRTFVPKWDGVPMVLGPNDTKVTLDRLAKRLQAEIDRSRQQAGLAGRSISSVTGTLPSLVLAIDSTRLPSPSHSDLTFYFCRVQILRDAFRACEQG
jgi:chromosome segregation ATPase